MEEADRTYQRLDAPGRVDHVGRPIANVSKVKEPFLPSMCLHRTTGRSRASERETSSLGARVSVLSPCPCAARAPPTAAYRRYSRCSATKGAGFLVTRVTTHEERQIPEAHDVPAGVGCSSDGPFLAAIGVLQ